MSYDICLEIEELRAIIEGRRVYRKCPSCFGKGFEYYCGDTGEVFPDQSKDEDYYETITSYLCIDQCDNCKGLGYVIAILE